jgi:hypothetical protein
MLADRLSLALDEINKVNKARLTRDMPVTPTDRQIAINQDELDCYGRLTGFCGGSLVGRLARKAGLSADNQYEVDQLSARTIWPTPNTATTTFYLRLGVKGAQTSAEGSAQVSDNLLTMAQQREH